MIAATIAVVIGAGASLARHGSVALTTIWAEDGTVYLQQALELSSTEAIGRLYAGYLQLTPRLIAEMVVRVPLHLAAPLLATGAALVVALLALVVFRASAGHIRSTWVRVAVAAAVVLVPVAQQESFNNIANLHWWLMFATFWVLVWRADDVLDLTLGAVVVALAVLSDPLTLVLLPLAVARALALRGWRHQIVTAALFIGGAVAVLAAVTGPSQRDFPLDASPARLVGWYVRDVLIGAVGGHNLIAVAEGSIVATAFLLAMAVAVLGLFAGLYVRHMRAAGPLPAVAVVASFGLFAAPAVLTGISAPRYAVAPVLLLVSAVTVVFDRLLAHWREHLPAVQVSVVAAVILVAGLWTANLPAADGRRLGPTWGEALTEARASCSHDPHARTAVPITPDGWYVALECEVLEH